MIFKLCRIFVLWCLIFHTAGNAADGALIRTTLQRHWEAMGGNNWLKVESIQLKGTIERDGQIVDVYIVKKRPNQIRATVTRDLSLPGNEKQQVQMIRAHDGETGWTGTRLAGTSGMVKEKLPPDAAAELLADAGVLPRLIKLWRGGAELTRLDVREIEGRKVLPIQAREKDSPLSYTFFLDNKTFRLNGYESRNSLGAVTTVKLDDYIVDAGVYLAKKSTIESSATGRSVMQADTVEVGVGIYDDYFKLGQPTAAADPE